MLVPLFLAAAAAAAQPAPPLARTVPHPGRAFISPMGEPFHGSSSGQDGLLAWFAAADANHDGRMTIDEMKQDGERFFRTLDVNHDGEIDPDEIDRYENVIAPEVRVATGYAGGASNDEASGGGRLGLLTVPEPVAAADTSFNRGVSLVEFDVAAASRFRLLDTNRDGSLTVPELVAMRQAIRSNARSPRNNKPAADDNQQSDPHSAENPGTRNDDPGGGYPGGR